MRRGTTPTVTYTTPFEADAVAGGYITFKQETGDLQIDIPIEDEAVTVTDNQIAVELTQEQTISLSDDEKCRTQLRLILSNGEVVASNIVKFKVDEILKDGVI